MGDVALVDAITEKGLPMDKNAMDPAIAAIMKPDEKETVVSEKVATDEVKNAEGAEAAPEEASAESDEDDLFDEEEGEGEEETSNQDPDVAVTVDGEQKIVKLSQLTQNYALQGATEKRLQQATELRNGYYQVGEQLYSNLQEQQDRLANIDAALKEVAEPQIDWAHLRANDPARYLIEKERTREAQDKRNLLSQEQQRVNHEQQQLMAVRHRIEVQAETGKFLEAMPALRNPAIAKAFSEATMDVGARVYGLSPDEIGSISKSSHMMVLADAVRYRLLLQRRAQRGSTKAAPREGEPQMGNGSVKPLLRPGANKQFSARMSDARDAKAVRARAQQTGDVDDVAKMLIVKRAK